MYTGGKVDWLSHGLPSEGTHAQAARVGSLVKRDVPRCHLTDTLEEIQRRIPQEWHECVVVNAQDIVLGILDTSGWSVDPRLTAEQAMRSGPATFRPRHSISDALMRMRRHDTQYVLVTTPEGRLIGILTRGDVEGASAETAARP